MKKIAKRNFKLLSLLIIAFLFIGNSFAQNEVIWKFSSKKTADDEAVLIFKAEIAAKWHLYSVDVPANGPLPTEFKFAKTSDFKVVGKPSESPKPHEAYEEAFEMNIKSFEDKATFSQKIKLLSDKDFVIKGEVLYMICTGGACMPGDAAFEIKVPGATIKETTEEDIEDGSESQIDSLKEDTATDIEQAKNDTVPETEAVAGTDDESTDDDMANKSLWGFFILAFIGGLLGAITPCVYPMIPMTVSFFLNQGGSKAQGKFKALFYGLSIIAIYTVFGVLITVIFGGSAIKDFADHYITNIAFFLVFLIFAASFLGMFEITLPSSLVNKADKQADRGGFIGVFFMGLTLVLVSVSCTGPILGYILVEAASGELLLPVIGMLGFSTAFALPFTILAVFPSLMGNLPKSGGWMNSVKVVLAFLILGFGMKFLVGPNAILAWGIPREVFLAVWIVLAVITGLYLLGKIKFSHDSDLKHVSVPRIILVIIFFSFAVYLIPGMFGAPLKALSGFTPTESAFDLPQLIKENRGGGTAEAYPSICDEKPKYSDKFHFPQGLKGYFTVEEGLQCAKDLNKPILLDFKGHGCVNCKIIEKNVWSDPEVMKRLRENYIIIGLYCDDRSDIPESDWVKSNVDGKMKNTIGKINLDYQNEKYNIIAQPYYVLVDHNLKNLVKPRAFDQSVEGYIEFLDKGVEEFNKRNKK